MTYEEERDCKAMMTCRAVRCWELMDDNDIVVVRVGMIPAWTAEEDLGGKAPGEGWRKIEGEEHRLQALALYDEAERRGKPLVV